VSDPSSQYRQWPHELDRECQVHANCEIQSPVGCGEGAKLEVRYCASKNAEIKVEEQEKESVCHELQYHCLSELINFLVMWAN
jgi:hypothetical protein